MSNEQYEWVFDPSLPDNGPKVNTAVWCLFAVATLFLGLRIYCKFRRSRGLWWDDHVLIASWVTFLVACIQLSVNIAHGFGRPGVNIDPEKSYDVGLGGMIVGTMVLISPALSKTSFILTVSKISGPRLKMALWFIAASINLLQAAALIIQFVQCFPLEKVWNFYAEGSCWGRQVNLIMSMTSSAYSGFMDLVLAAIPWVVLKDLQIKRKEKIGIAVAMSLGVVAGITAFVKCAKQKLLASSDFTLEGGELIIWASAEISATIIAASVPVLRTLARELSTTRSGRFAGYFRSSSGTDARGDRSHPGRNTTSSANVATVSAYKTGVSVTESPDAASDKSILEGTHGKGGGKIVKTEEINIKFADRGDEGSIQNYEMHDLEARRY